MRVVVVLFEFWILFGLGVVDAAWCLRFDCWFVYWLACLVGLWLLVLRVC